MVISYKQEASILLQFVTEATSSKQSPPRLHCSLLCTQKHIFTLLPPPLQLTGQQEKVEAAL